MAKNNKNIYWIVAGVINSFTALLHIIGGQIDLVNPLLKSTLDSQIKTEWLGVWHIVTVVLVMSSYHLLRNGINTSRNGSEAIVKLFGILYLLFSAVFIISSLSMNMFAPQWILLLPIGALSLVRKN